MMSLFSSFDVYFFKIIFILIFVALVLIFTNIFKITVTKEFFLMTFKIFQDFLFSLKPKSFSKLSIYAFSILFFFIFFINFSSVNSFVFPLTSQLSMVLLFSSVLWISFIMFQIFFNLKGFLSHCVPEGTPLYLVSFLFAIELISNFIRPMTLTVRLVANILAGHLLMILLSKLVLTYFSIFFFYISLNLIEIFVSMIQSYIFVTMITLYYSELN